MISLVGRPNVGKSSLFNALLKKKQALVLDYEGVTRDRRFAQTKVEELGGRTVNICDTGGWMPIHWRKGRDEEQLLEGIEKQIVKALEESSLIVIVVNAREGMTALDEDIITFVRRLGRPFVIAANKIDVPAETHQMGDFFSAGADDVIPVSAEHKWGIVDFWERIAKFLPDAATDIKPANQVAVSIVGRPNVGKSSLLNRIVGEERSVAHDMPGTTTDPVDVTIERVGRSFLLVDTAGIRRHSRRKDDVEDLGVMYAERSLDRADIAFFVIDAAEGFTHQDSRIAATIEDAGCACIVLANKWDMAPHHIKSDSKDGLKKFRELMEKEWPFLDFAPLVAISASKGKFYGAEPGSDALDPEEGWHLPTSFEDIWRFALEMVAAREKKVSNQELREVVEEALAVGPKWALHMGELRQIHQVGNRPPQFLAYVLDANKVPEALRRYLKRAVRERFGYRGNPIRWVFRHKHSGDK